MKVEKFGIKPLVFVFGDENTEQQYKIKNLNCTEEEFFEWLDTFEYDNLESQYGIHDFSGGETDNEHEVGFSSYEISKKDFPIVMEIWRKGLLDAGFITEDQEVEIEGEENTPIIWIRNEPMDYEERFEIQRISKETFDDYLESFEEYLHDNLSNEDAEFDGDQGGGEYLIQLMDEEDDWKETFKKVVKKIKKFFKNERLDLEKIENE